MKEFLVIFVVFTLIEILKQYPPLIFLNYNSDRLYKKIMHLLKTMLDKSEIKLKERAENSTFTKKELEEFRDDTNNEIKELIALRNIVYEIIGNYQDKSVKYNHIVKTWIEYLQIYEELEEASSHDEVGAVEIIGYDNMRIKQFKLEANKKALKELLKISNALK